MATKHQDEKHPHPEKQHEKHPVGEKLPHAEQLPTEPPHPAHPIEKPRPEHEPPAKPQAEQVKYERAPPAEGKVRVRMEETADEGVVTHGTQSYHVPRDDRMVDLPPEAAQHVIRQGGGQAVEPRAPEVEGTLKVKHGTDPKATFSYGDKDYEPDEEGVLTVPIAVAEEVAAHGFHPIPA